MAERIVEAAELSHDDVVVEVGPGKGALTRFLVDKARVIAVELDGELCRRIEDEFGDKVVVKREDARFFDTSYLPMDYKLVSNLPYSMGTVILKNFVSSYNPPKLSVVMLQKEVADRIIGVENSYLTVFFSMFTVPEKLFDVSPGCFYPPPKVTSTVLKLRRKKPPLSWDELRDFLEFSKALFNARRKKIGTTLKRLGFKSRVPFSDRRPEELSPDELVVLYKEAVKT